MKHPLFHPDFRQIGNIHAVRPTLRPERTKHHTTELADNGKATFPPY